MEPRLSDELYGRFRDLLDRKSGLYYPEQKRTDLLHGLSLVLIATGHTSYESLYADAYDGGVIWETILTHLTIGETSFFRNKPQFQALREYIVPELIHRRADVRALRIWSAGCATGEEPYSIAILLNQLLSDRNQWNTTILATDINPNFLERARQALYGNWSFREMPDELREQYFTREQQRWRLNESIRRMVTFARLNLVEPCYPSLTNGTWALDMILCRNVTIYFSEETTRLVVERFYRSLAPGGWLVVGHAEPQSSIYHQFEVHNFTNAVIYRKPLDAQPFFFDFTSSIPSVDVSYDHTTSSPTPQRIVTPSFSSSPPTPPLLTDNRTSSPPSSLRPRTPSTPAPSTSRPPPPPPTTPARANIPKPTADPWIAISECLSHGDKTNAEAVLQQILRTTPTDSRALTMLGRLAADRGEWAEAQRYCEEATKHDPMLLESHYILAQVYENQGNLEQALAEYRRTVYLDRTFVLGMMGMANVWRQMGRVHEAQRGYRNVLKQLAGLAPFALVPGGDGATVRDLVSFTMHQLQALK